MIDINSVHEMVQIFYKPPFKTFYINSKDGAHFIKPTGVFVSLGITTSMPVLRSVCDAIKSCSEYTGNMVEISSSRCSGQFINTITKEDSESNPLEQYLVTEIPEDSYTKEEAEKLLHDLREKYNDPSTSPSEIYKLSGKISSLAGLCQKLDQNDSWEDNYVIEDSVGFRVYHKLVNYIKENDIEYRIGIYVTEV